MSQRCRNDVVMGVLPEKGINGTLWNVMGPVRNGDGKGERKKQEWIHGKNRKVRRRLVTLPPPQESRPRDKRWRGLGLCG